MASRSSARKLAPERSRRPRRGPPSVRGRGTGGRSLIGAGRGRSIGLRGNGSPSYVAIGDSGPGQRGRPRGVPWPGPRSTIAALRAVRVHGPAGHALRHPSGRSRGNAHRAGCRSSRQAAILRLPRVLQITRKGERALSPPSRIPVRTCLCSAWVVAARATPEFRPLRARRGRRRRRPHPERSSCGGCRRGATDTTRPRRPRCQAPRCPFRLLAGPVTTAPGVCFSPSRAPESRGLPLTRGLLVSGVPGERARRMGGWALRFKSAAA